MSLWGFGGVLSARRTASSRRFSIVALSSRLLLMSRIHKKDQVRQYRRKCVFCDRPAKMTHEHVWGQWIAPYINASANSHRAHQVLLRTNGQHREGSKKRPGAPLVANAPVVCGDCNSGWMSVLQNTAKEYIIPLIEAKPVLVTQEAQDVIAAWATMVTITSEYVYDGDPAISHDDRRAFFAHRTPLPGWRISIGNNYRSNHGGFHSRCSMPIHFKGDMIVPSVHDPEAPIPNSQWSAVAIGHFYCLIASSSTASDWILGWDWRNEPRARSLLITIWPRSESFFVWPPTPMTDVDVPNFLTAQFRYIQSRAIMRRGRGG